MNFTTGIKIMLEKSGQSCNSSAGESVKITDIISLATSADRILSDLLLSHKTLAQDR